MLGGRFGTLDRARHGLGEREAASAQTIRSLAGRPAGGSRRRRRRHARRPLLRNAWAGVFVTHLTGPADQFATSLHVADDAVALLVLESQVVAALGDPGFAGALEKPDRFHAIR